MSILDFSGELETKKPKRAKEAKWRSGDLGLGLGR
jgi:hypothetical protein